MPSLSIISSTQLLEDTGGNIILVTGDLLASNPSDYVYSARLRKNGTSTYSQYLYAAVEGQGIYSRNRGNVFIMFSSPIIAPGSYDLVVEFGPVTNPDSSDFEIFNCITVQRALRKQEAYDLRSNLPPRFNAGERELSKDEIIASSSSTLRDTSKQSVLEIVTSIMGDELNRLKGASKTVLTDAIYLNAGLDSQLTNTINVESTFGIEGREYLFINGDKCRIVSYVGNTITIQAYKPFIQHAKGSEVLYASFTD